MAHRKAILATMSFLFSVIALAQKQKIVLDATLKEGHRLEIHQEIQYINSSGQSLDTLWFLNWSNAFVDRETPLSRRLIENHQKNFYFAKKEERGYSKVHSVRSGGMNLRFLVPAEQQDLLAVVLNEPLQPGAATKIDFEYEIKVANDRFTRYGQNGVNYNLRYWYLTPAVFDGIWHTYSHLNMDDYYMAPTDYKMLIRLPVGYTLQTDLLGEVSLEDSQVIYNLSDSDRLDVELSIQVKNEFSIYSTSGPEVITNLRSKNLTENIKGNVIQRQLDFIENFLGTYPHKRLLVNRSTYLKHPVYGFNQLPKSMNPFSDIFEWDIKMFKALSHKFIENTLLNDPRNDNWLPEGIQIYLMMAYVNRYYPEVKAIGNISKKWGIRNYSIAQLDFNGKYPFVYQFSTRKQLDQPLSTRADSLSNFNQKLVNRYKSGLGLRYLDSYLQDSIVDTTLKAYYEQNAGKLSHSSKFTRLLEQNSDKNLDWYFDDYLTTRKKINYTIKSAKTKGDSVEVVLKNKSNFNAPLSLYGIHDDEVAFKSWIEPFEGESTFSVPKGDLEKISLNYEFLYPESNHRDNWKKIDRSVLNRPLRFRFYRDIEDPYYNQVFYKPFIGYNLYDGLLLGPTIYNQSLFKKTWLFSATPVYGFSSKAITGAFSLAYEFLPEDTSIYRYRAGLAFSRSHYDEKLAFNKFTPFFRIDFKRKSLRDVGGKSLMTRYVMVDKDIPEGIEETETYKYGVFNIRYANFKPEIIHDLRYFADFQYQGDFSKLAIDLRYRKLTSINRYLDFRLYLGAFLFNDTSTDFFSFATDRPSDYMFDLNYLARSESSGFLSQEIIITEGGFKSIFEDRFANEWIASTNFSIGLWRWIELYGDAGFLKNRNEDARFKYDSGIRLNFLHNFLEVYFPLQSSLGFEPGFSDYGSRIRFVLTLDPERIYNFVKRGFY